VRGVESVVAAVLSEAVDCGHTRCTQATQWARHRKRLKAQQAGQTTTAPTRAVAEWLLLRTTLEALTWSAADVLYIYRVR
jgi:hypothetical protein